MCGIAGFVNFDLTEQLVNDIVCSQVHRGPDANNMWHDKNVILAHQRLSIIDLNERSNQPFVKKGFVIIFNGEIYNYKELRQELEQQNPEIHFITNSDTEVLLELYIQKKESCLDHVIGMFAFAIYETSTGLVFIARDHFGIKPLYYTNIHGAFAFASELKTLVKTPGFKKQLNYTSLVAAINYLWVPGNETMFEGCYKLPAAHYLYIDSRTLNKEHYPKRYWHLNTKIKYKNEEEAVSALSKEIEETIERHMVADVPVSSFLSGGLDSSLISVLASKKNHKLSTYTICSSSKDKKVEQMPDDEKYARKLAEQFGFDHHEILITPDIVKELPNMVYILDEPIGDPAAINTYLICKAASDKGVKVLLSGMGADEIFLGYRRQKATLHALHYKKVPNFCRKVFAYAVNMLPVRINGKGVKLSRWAKRFLKFAELPTEEAYMLSYSYYNEDELKQLFKIEIYEYYKKLREQHASFFNQEYKDDNINKMCYTDIHMFMQGLNLSYSDKASMAASVEVRVPFIDKKVIELGMQIDGSLKLKQGKSKYILKKVAEKYLPHEIIYRPKASFGAPIRSWISNDLRFMVDELLSKENIERRGIFNYEYIKKLIEEDRNGVEDNAYRIYQLLTMEIWLSKYT